MRVRELYTNYQLYVLFFLPRMRLRPTRHWCGRQKPRRTSSALAAHKKSLTITIYGNIITK